jgi:D-arabinose 1-dehydrogenase-like Zn-dependent alcohol dehydrogenase
LKAAQVFEYRKPVRVVEVEEPKISSPWDVIIRIGGAGVCRTDLHIQEGQMKEIFHPSLPYTLGHENSGWIETVGSEVQGFSRGDPVILHPQITCGFCRACRRGDDMYCENSRFPGVDGTAGGYAEFLKTSARCVIKLAPGTNPVPLAPFADAGITAYHAVKRIERLTTPESTIVVVGVGGLGHIAIQLLKTITPARLIALDITEERLALARKIGADEVILAGRDGGVKDLLEKTSGTGCDIVLDFVGERDTPANAIKMLKRGGTYSIIGYGGTVSNTTLDMIAREITIMGNFVGTFNDLAELMELNRQGKVSVTHKTFGLSEAADVMEKLNRGEIQGRAVLDPLR